MARLLFTWELGGNYGHLARLVPLAQVQEAQGHEVLFAINNLQVAEQLLKPSGFKFVLVDKVSGTVSQTLAWSYSYLLLAIGYGEKTALQQAVSNWLNLFEQYQPDIIIADHSPTVLLANKVTKIPALQFGGGFEIPPENCWPAILPVKKADLEEMQKSQQKLLENMNRAIVSNKGESMHSVSALFDDCYQLITSFAELDHYTTRQNRRYIGPLYDLDNGQEASWKNSNRPKIFVYVWSNLSGLNQLMAAFSTLNVEVIAVIPNLNNEALSLFTKENVQVFTESVRLKELIATADLLITHSGFATVSAFLKFGVPVLVVPDNLERAIVGQRIADLGVGLIMGYKRQEHHFIEVILYLLQTKEFKSKAQKFSEKYKNWHPNIPLNDISDVINQLLNSLLTSQ